MSSKALHAQLIEAIERLQDTIDSDIRDRAAAGSDFPVTSRLLSEYLWIYNRLEECYDQTIQTQRRINIREVLIRTVTRYLELYWLLTRPTVLQEGQEAVTWQALANTIRSQTQSIDLIIPTPRIVKDDIGPSFALREDLISKFFKQFEEARVASDIAKPPAMPLEDAALLVQRCERARRARHETFIKRGIQQQQASMTHPKKSQRDEVDREKCANTIKQFWKKFGARHKERQRRDSERELIGMKAIPRTPAFTEKVDRNEKRRKEEERRRKQELDAAMEVSRAWLRDNKQVDLERKLSELNAEYYNEVKLETGKAPTIKPKTNVLQTLFDRAEESPDAELGNLVAEQAAKKTKAKPEEAKKEAPKGGGGGKGKEEVPIPVRLTELQEALQRFNDLWNREDQGEATDSFDVQLARKEMWTSMLPDIALNCENNLKQELKNLKILEMRRVRKARPPRVRKKRQRKSRDPLGGKTDEEVLAQLVGLGIACSSPNITFRDFVGDNGMAMDGGESPCYATMGSEMMIEAVLPFACDREKISDIPKGVLISGNKGTGKSTLALAAIQALGATFLNFSPCVLVGKETPTPRILVLMLLKAARVLAPSVILVDDIDRMFGRGKKADASKKFKAQFRKNIRKVKPKDRILLIGTTSQFPLPKPCSTLFNREISIPKPGFPTRVAVWNFWLAKKNLIMPSISVNALAFASDGYTAASIARACNKANRVKISRTEPNDPITDREILKFLADAPEDESKPQVQFAFGGFKPTPVMAKKG
jgi:hypothetical protein